MAEPLCLLINLVLKTQEFDMGHYVKEFYFSPVEEPEPQRPIITEDNFFQPVTKYEQWLFDLAFSNPIKALKKLQQWREELPELFNEPLNNRFPGSDVVPSEITKCIDIPLHWIKKPVHFLEGGYANYKNVRISYAANPNFYFTREEPVRYWLNKIFKETLFTQRSPQRILDIGCGTGISTFQYGGLFPDAEVIGIDLGAPFVRFCRAWKQKQQTYTNVQFYQQNGEITHWPDGYFDIIHVTYVLHEMPAENAERILKEAYRLLKVNGFLSVMDVAYSQMKEDRKMRVQRGTLGWLGSFVELLTGFHGPEPFLDEYMNKFKLPQAIISAGFVGLQRHYDIQRYYFNEDDGYFLTAFKAPASDIQPLPYDTDIYTRPFDAKSKHPQKPDYCKVYTSPKYDKKTWGDRDEGNYIEMYIPEKPFQDISNTRRLVIYLHGYALGNSQIYLTHIEHLAQQGYYVAYPSYQRSLFQLSEHELDNESEITNKLVDTLKPFPISHQEWLQSSIKSTMYACEQVGLTKAAVDTYIFGHSLGGLFALSWLYYLEDKNATECIVPKQIIAVDPAPDSDSNIPKKIRDILNRLGAFKDKISIKETGAELKAPVAILHGNDDIIVPKESWIDPFRYIASKQKTMYLSFSDDHGIPVINADHQQTTIDTSFVPNWFAQKFLGGYGSENNLDWRYVWYALDQVIRDDTRADLLKFDMGEWSDGTPVRAIKVYLSSLKQCNL
jgi:ubiquinone/menaquinone biosynthesis C-methylase UbiE